MSLCTLWVYKCNSLGEPYASAVGDFSSLFRNRRAGIGVRWGGLWSTKNPISRRIISELMKPGDLILCYQVDRREAIGICELVGFVDLHSGYRKGRNLILKVVEEFPEPVKLLDLKKKNLALKKVGAFRSGPIQTLYGTSEQDARVLLAVCGSRFSSDWASRRSHHPKKDEGRKRDGGGGFGSPEENARVEKKAIAFVKRWYSDRGWKVSSCEGENIGYDLKCSRNGHELHVEVKGSKGSGDGFIITKQEHDLLSIDSRLIVAVVSDALGSPKCSFRKGRDILRQYQFQIISYRASRKQ